MSQFLKQAMYKTNLKTYLILVHRASVNTVCTFMNKEGHTRGDTNIMITLLSAVHFATQTTCKLYLLSNCHVIILCMQDAQIFLQPQLLPRTARSRCSPALLRPQRIHSSLILYSSRVKCHLLLNNIGFTYYYRFYPADGVMTIIIIKVDCFQFLSFSTDYYRRWCDSRVYCSTRTPSAICEVAAYFWGQNTHARIFEFFR